MAEYQIIFDHPKNDVVAEISRLTELYWRMKRCFYTKLTTQTAVLQFKVGKIIFKVANNRLIINPVALNVVHQPGFERMVDGFVEYLLTLGEFHGDVKRTNS